jgi:hypothetical protein
MSTKHSHLWHHIALLVVAATIVAGGYQISRDRDANLNETSRVVKNPSAGYAVVLPANWELLNRSVSSNAPASQEDDGRFLQAERTNSSGDSGADVLDAPVLTVTFYEKSRQESVREVLQRRGTSVPSNSLVTVSPLAGRPTMRSQVERVQTVTLELTDMEYYIDDGNRLYDIGLAATMSDTRAQQEFYTIASSFQILQEGN